MPPPPPPGALRNENNQMPQLPVKQILQNAMIDPGSGVLLFTELDGVVREDQLLSVSFSYGLAKFSYIELKFAKKITKFISLDF